MKEYEIINEDKVLGKIQIYNNIKNYNSIIKSLTNTKYKILDSNKNQQNYIVSFYVNNIDDVIKIIEKYTNDIENTLEYIKELNKVKVIKKPTYIDFVIPKSSINKFNINKNNIDLQSLLESKIYFIKKTNKYNIDDLIININKFLESSEFKFMLDIEKNEMFNKYLQETDKIIKEIEDNTIFKYGRDFIRAIRIISD